MMAKKNWKIRTLTVRPARNGPAKGAEQDAQQKINLKIKKYRSCPVNM
jgi:hypothetical protein